MPRRARPCRSKASPALAVPESTSPPGGTATGIGSPVSAEPSITASDGPGNGAVGRDDLPRPDHEHVPDLELLDRHLHDRRAVPAMPDAGRPVDQGAQLAARPTLCVVLEGVAPGEHERDDRAGEVLVEGERPADGDERDRVYADVPVEERADDADRERHERRSGRYRPENVGSVVVSGECENRSGDERDQDPHDQGPVELPSHVREASFRTAARSSVSIRIVRGRIRVAKETRPSRPAYSTVTVLARFRG